MSESADSANPGVALDIYEEFVVIDVGPTVFQHMDMNYGMCQTNESVARQVKAIYHDHSYHALTSKVNEELDEDTSGGNKTILINYYHSMTTEDDCDGEHVRQQKDLQQHLLHQKPNTSAEGFTGDACIKTFHKSHLLRAHQKLHQRNNSKNSAMTRTDVLVPTSHGQDEFAMVKQKPFECDICQNRFSSKALLIFHKLSHSGLRENVCYICDTRFRRKSDLTKHLKRHTDEKSYQCDICGAQFECNFQLTKHMRVHTGEKPYHCDMCSAKFARSDVLTTHMRVHTGEKPYQCDMCSAKFAQSSPLTQHMRVHTGEKPYKCTECGAKFAQNGHLKTHRRTRHTNKEQN